MAKVNYSQGLSEKVRVKVRVNVRVRVWL